ncbi:MAG: sugar phosphate isomerase/epimerase [Clostridiales bacterium]|nr:sugar phosphate isomerase/epimerase [Clostridiales bacterium]
MERLPIAVQVYSVRQEAEADFAGTMAKIKEMGYDGVELAGLYGKTPAEIRACLDSVGLKAISAHIPYEEFEKDLEGTVKAYQEIGCEFAGIPWLSEERRYGGEKYEETLSYIPVIAKACREHGMQLMYHNHDFEFAKAEDGRYHLDILYSTLTPEELCVELDTCWAKVAGENPAEYLMKYQGRCPVVHIKDFRKKEEVELLALGEGEQNLEELTDSVVKCGAKWFIIEQDDHPYGTPMGNLKKSIDCLKNIIEK